MKYRKMAENIIKVEGFDSAKYKLENGNGFTSAKKRQSQQYMDLSKHSKSLMFRDGIRKIDMIICFEEDIDDVEEFGKRLKREMFLKNLVKEGLELEIEDKVESIDEKTNFVKIHMPGAVEIKYAEAFNMKLPVRSFVAYKTEDETDAKHYQTCFKSIKNWMSYPWNYAMKFLDYDESCIDKEPSFYEEIKNCNSRLVYLQKKRFAEFNGAQKSALVMQILLRTKFDDSVEKVGIQNLINSEVFSGCFSLHEEINEDAEVLNDRTLLDQHWASFRVWYKRQPLWLIKKYFGEKIALYFCWLGFYTKMLVVPAIVGLICFFYGFSTMNSSDNVVSKEICNSTGVGGTVLCPLCDKACSYMKLSDSCSIAKLSNFFDNPATVFFAIFMSFWATTFLELWKRRQAVVVWEWDLENVEKNEVARPEYELSVKTYQINPVTKKPEPYMSSWMKVSRVLISTSGVLTMVVFVLAAFLGVIIYRISILGIIYSSSGEDYKKHAKLFTTFTASLINFTLIMTMTRIYRKIAEMLTNFENPRTQTEFEDSYAFKIFVLEFNNFYGSLIYIAFFKGRFFKSPGDKGFLNLRADVCGHSGCLIDLCIQLAIIMIGKQIINNLREYFMPKITIWWRKRTQNADDVDDPNLLTAWERDFSLEDLGRLPLFEEYKELIIQYGFVTLFVAAFPLAPLFALINNIFETRLDANKMVNQSRRPLAERAEDIGAWFGILEIITQIGIVSNAFVIAFTSDFIPKTVYRMYYSPNHSLESYVQHSLLKFNTTEFKSEWGSKGDMDPEVCYYRGFRDPFKSDEPFGENIDYWHIMFARFAFVVVFEHIVFLLTKLMQFVIPDTPKELKIQIKYEQLATKEKKLEGPNSPIKYFPNTDVVDVLSADIQY